MKRVLSILSIVAMLITMLATIVVPVSAETTTLVNQFVLDTNNMYYVNANGTTGASNNFYSSDYIEVAAGDTLYLGPCDPGQGYQFVTFDADKANGVQIKAASLTVVETLAGGGVIYSYVVPEGVAYIRMTAAAIYARWFLLTRNQAFDGAALMRYIAATKPVTRNDYDKSKAQAGYYNANKSVTSHASHYSAEEMTVAKNDTIFFGPCNTSQSFHLYYWKTDGTATKVNKSSSYMKIVDTYDNGQVIYAYRCPDAGTVGVVNASAYNDYFMISKNDPMVVQSYFDYLDAKENANLYYIQLDKSNAYLNDDGTFKDSASHSLTHYISVKGGDKITFGPANPGQSWHLMAFDANKTPILPKVNASSLTAGEKFASGATIYTYTVPANAAFVKVCNATGYKNLFLVTKNNEFDVKEYNEITGNSEAAEGEIIVQESVLNGKSALFVGDSICYGSQDTATERGWAGRIAKYYGLAYYTNNGVSGASLSTARWRENGNASSKVQGKILFQVTQEASYYYDYIVLHGGVNDAWDSYPVGEMTDSFNVEDFDVSTYAGALEELFYYTTKQHPTARIGYLMNFYAPACTNGRVGDMSEYFAVGKQICEKWNMPYFDMYNNAEITAALKFDTKEYTNDYIHPIASGYDVLYPFIGEWMETLTPYSTVTPAENEKTVIACVGDSITKGERSGDVNRYSYPAQLQDMLGDEYEVLNLGWGGATAQNTTSNPYKKTTQYRQAKESNADIVIVKLAHNDTKSANWDSTNPEAAKAKFKTALKELVVEMQNLPSEPVVYMVTPSWALGSSTDTIFADYMIPAINEIATELGCTVIDVNTVTQNKTELYSLEGTNVHPNKEGYALIAETVYKSLMGKAYEAPAPVDTSVPETDPAKPLMVNYEKYPDATAYRLETVADVEKFGDLIASGVTFVGKTVYLMNDIDFTGLKFTPLGASAGMTASNEIDYNRAFQGTFDGQYHVFKNVEIESMWWDTALFPVLHRATIKNFGMDGGSVRGHDVVGSIVGYGDYACVIENVWSSADVYAASKSGIQASGGIASNMRRTGNGTTTVAGTSTMKNVAYYGELNAVSLVGGICAWGQSGGHALQANNIIFGGKITLRGKPNNGSADFVRYGAAVTGVTSNFGVVNATPGFKPNYDTVPTTLTMESLADGSSAAILNLLQVGVWGVRDGLTVPVKADQAPIEVTVEETVKYTDYQGKLIDQKALETSEYWAMNGETYTAEELLAYTYTAPVTLTATEAPLPPAPTPDGDANGDDLVNSADVTAILVYLNGGEVADSFNADINNDGKITLADALRLLKSLNA